MVSRASFFTQPRRTGTRRRHRSLARDEGSPLAESISGTGPGLARQILADEFESIDAEGAVPRRLKELDYVRKNSQLVTRFALYFAACSLRKPHRVVSGTGYIETKAQDGKKGSRTEYPVHNVLSNARADQAISSHVLALET